MRGKNKDANKETRKFELGLMLADDGGVSPGEKRGVQPGSEQCRPIYALEAVAWCTLHQRGDLKMYGVRYTQ